MNPGSSTRAQDFLQRDKFFASLRAEGQEALHAGESFVERLSRELALGKFTDTALILAAIETHRPCLVLTGLGTIHDGLQRNFGKG